MMPHPGAHLVDPHSGPHDPSLKTVRAEELWRAWPREGASELGRSLGGDVPKALAACGDEDGTMRLSRALNACGHPITGGSTWTGATIVDSSGAHYLAQASDMRHLLEHTLKHHEVRRLRSESDAHGRQGIILFGQGTCTHPSPPHFDVLHRAEYGDVRSSGMWGQGREVLLWELL